MGRIWEGFETFLVSLGELFFLMGGGEKHVSPHEGPRATQELSWVRFWVDLEGFLEGSGRILELKIDVFLAVSAHVA